MSIVLEGVAKSFGAQRVVDDVSLEIASGELFVLLGASGSGKSTILRLIAGLATADRGRIVIDGRDVTDEPPQSRGTGFVFQNYSLFRHMTVAENVEFGLKLRRVAAPERAERREALLAQVELAGLGERMPDQLSGGQRQRVALARALAYAPNVLLLDEPFGALDAKIRIQLRRSLRALQDDLAVTTVLVTHDQEEAFELADRVAIVDRGRLIEVGKPEDLYARPRTLFAATFLGGGAVLGGTSADGILRLGRAAIPLPAELPATDGQSVLVLVRPEHVQLQTNPPADDAVVLGQGEVIESTFVGAQRRLRVRLPRPAGARQLAPRTAFGTTGWIVDAVVPAEMPLSAGTLWVVLRAWHILTAEAPHILWVPPPDDPNADHAVPPPIVDALVQAFGAQIRLVAVAGQRDGRAAMRARLDALAQHFAAADPIVHVRHGDPATIVLAEHRTSDFDLLILPPALRAGSAPVDGVDSEVRRVVEQARGPVLVARGGEPLCGRILICTAAGEPGKGDVEVGGRLAARLRADVTLLYIHIGARGPAAAATHLDRAAAAIADRGLTCTLRQRDAASAVEGIVAELGSERYDLVVIGSHVRPAGARSVRNDVTAQVLAASDVSVLVVPDASGR